MLFSSCYSFKGISIPADVNTYYVEDFTLASSDAPGDLNQVFAQGLRQKIREESRLTNNNIEPDIIFKGSITRYTVLSVAPEEGSTTSLNRLEIGVRIEYENSLNEDESWTKNYSDFEDYDSSQDLQSLRDDLIDEIIEDIMERIFNDAFANW
ncbi:MAG: hypothetical protein HKN09_06515 [Saprospiraceae bacterium]|nr:hypothetical protein [Saprospiraceae bacterium]